MQAVLVIVVLLGIGILLGCNRQLIAAVHELRMTKSLRDRIVVTDADL